jgi:hypothetical protein
VAPSGQSGRHAPLTQLGPGGFGRPVDPEREVSLESVDDRPAERAVRRSADREL